MDCLCCLSVCLLFKESLGSSGRVGRARALRAHCPPCTRAGERVAREELGLLYGTYTSISLRAHFDPTLNVVGTRGGNEPVVSGEVEGEGGRVQAERIHSPRRRGGHQCAQRCVARLEVGQGGRGHGLG